jgi:ATP-dependent helicase/DNAse subunit B
MGSVPIALVTGPANAGKAHVLLEAVRGDVARGEHPLLVVPTEADEARYRRELAEGGLTLGVRVERFEGLLGEVLTRAGDTGAPLSSLMRERLLARIADVRPGMASELAKLVGELNTQRVTPARLRGALRAWEAAEGAPAGDVSAGDAPSRGAPVVDVSPAETSVTDGPSAAGTVAGGDRERSTMERVCDVFERYHAALAKMRRADRELRVTRALDTLRRRPSLWHTPVALYGFDDFTELQLDAIETLGGVVGARVTVSLPYEPGRVVFAGRAATFQRLAPLASAHTELPARADYYASHARQALHHLERSLLGEETTRVEPDEAVRLLEGGSPRAELELVAGEVRALLDMGVNAEEIAIVHRAPLTIAPLIGEVLADFEIPHALRARVMFAHTAVGRALLGLLRCALGGGDLGDLLAWLRAPGALSRPELADRLEASARRQGALDAARARALWEAEQWPLDRIDKVSEAAERGTPALADALVAELDRLFCAPRNGAAVVLDDDELDEARALVGARRSLEELRELARMAPEQVAAAAAASELVEALERLELHGGERVEAGQVAVVDPLSLRARRVRMVFACGLQEGVFPAPATPNPLLGEDDRRALAAASGLVLRGAPDALAAERYLLYALCSRPQERLTLSWHNADDDGTPVARSLFVDDICDLFSDALSKRVVRRAEGVAPKGRPASWPGPGRPVAPIASRGPGDVGSNGVRSGPIEPLRDERVLEELCARELWSASSLESWTSCPVKWFVERLLLPGEIDPRPEPIARGGLAHAALKSTLERLRERTGSARLTPASLGLAKRLLVESLEEHEPLHPLSVAPERLPGARRRLAVDLERYLEYAAEQASPFEPAHLELEFGFEQDGLAPLDLGEGVSLRGRIDRVDLCGDRAVVYDYKGRSAPPGARWIADGAFQVALYMRAVGQLLGHTPVGGFYQPLAGRDIKARGVLDGDSGVELDCVRTDRLDREDLHELIERCVAIARKAAAEARAGALQPRPDTCAYDGGCAYPTICRCER